jgi:hypothetical protein
MSVSLSSSFLPSSCGVFYYNKVWQVFVHCFPKKKREKKKEMNKTTTMVK